MPIRRVDAAFAEALAAAHAASFPPAERWSADAFAALLGQPGVRGFADGDGAFVLVRRAADEAEILTIAVPPALRRDGRGRALLDAASDDIRREGAASLFLEVAADNEAALALYRSRGFEPVGRRRDYYGGGRDALVLLLDLRSK